MITNSVPTQSHHYYLHRVTKENIWAIYNGQVSIFIPFLRRLYMFLYFVQWVLRVFECPIMEERIIIKKTVLIKALELKDLDFLSNKFDIFYIVYIILCLINTILKCIQN